MRNQYRRRQLLVATAASVAMLTLGRRTQGDTSETSYADPAATEAWMAAWMEARQPVGMLHMSRFKDRTYFLIKEIGWQSNPGEKKLPRVKVPKGFVTDFASIPRVFWSILPPDGEYTYPAIIHDYLYWTQTTSRETADEIFNAAMTDFKIDSTKQHIIFTGVRTGGQIAWNDNDKLKKSGEKRVLKQFPTDPTVTWDEWKASPSHF
jgi:hypothetical protein